MSAYVRILESRYVDSVVLMRLAQRLAALGGVEDAAAMMGTEANTTLLREGGFLTGATPAKADDLIVAIKASGEGAAAAALARVEELLQGTDGGASLQLASARSLEQALELRSDLNLAAISVPGEYAGTEARRALEQGLHVFLFSSNVELADEIDLKRVAAERGLLCMGPDCGTAIIAGKGLGFANAVRRGPVGVVGASGSGVQAVTSLLDQLGVGVSHAIGCGGRDLSASVGAATMRAGLDVLLEDAETEAILLLAKPPAPRVADLLRARVAAASKPIVRCFLGDPAGPITLDDAAYEAAEAAGSGVAARPEPLAEDVVRDLRARLRPEQRFVRGLYAGGTLGYEAQLLLGKAGLDVSSNAPLPGGRRLRNSSRSESHTVLDLGSEELTRGRPHPIIDSRTRRARLLQEADDPTVAVVLLDVVLGYGAARDPAGDLADAIVDARERARARGHELVVLAYVCGTAADPQGLVAQQDRLREAGALVLPTNSAAVTTAARVLSPAVSV
jgi:FdrA protein